MQKLRQFILYISQVKNIVIHNWSTRIPILLMRISRSLLMFIFKVCKCDWLKSGNEHIPGMFMYLSLVQKAAKCVYMPLYYMNE